MNTLGKVVCVSCKEPIDKKFFGFDVSDKEKAYCWKCCLKMMKAPNEQLLE